MKLLVVVVGALCIAHEARSQGLLGNIVSGVSNTFGNIFDGDHGGHGGQGGYADDCSQDAYAPYRKAQNDFYKRLYARVAAHSDNHFVFSPYTIWLSLAALAEGADPSVRPHEFSGLYLPQKKCMREKFYDIALHVGSSSHGVSLQKRRSLILDESLVVNPDWAKYVKHTGLLDVAVAPIKSNPKATSRRLKEYLGSRSNIVLNGNSVVLDSLDYHGLWAKAFPESNTHRAPFYNDMGHQIGSVNMMRTKRRVRLAHLPFSSTKILELPVGDEGRYSMLIAVGTGNNLIKNAFESFLGSVFDIFSMLELSVVPIEIAIPKFSMSAEFDVKPALNEIGIDWYWKNPKATSYVSHPPAMPGGLIQRVSVKFDSAGYDSGSSHSSGGLFSGLVNMASDTATGIATAVGQEFIADRPFMFALFDTKTHTCLFAGAYSRPHGQ